MGNRSNIWRGMTSGLWRRLYGVKSQLYLLLAVWPWLNYFISLCSSIFVCKTGMIKYCTRTFVMLPSKVPTTQCTWEPKVWHQPLRKGRAAYLMLSQLTGDRIHGSNLSPWSRVQGNFERVCEKQAGTQKYWGSRFWLESFGAWWYTVRYGKVLPDQILLDNTPFPSWTLVFKFQSCSRVLVPWEWRESRVEARVNVLSSVHVSTARLVVLVCCLWKAIQYLFRNRIRPFWAGCAVNKYKTLL